MAVYYYKDAQKQGQKEFRACTAKGLYPYLPSLDEILPAEKLNQGKPVGTVQIPMDFIVGNYSAGRTRAFARNFMPLLEEGTEFADKWRNLCKAHLEEGIRDPAKVYEYLNRYYVAEGNKRVSVLKFFGAVTVYADVIRILPERNGSEETELYFELVDFYDCSKVNFLEFTKPGSYLQLQRTLGKAPGESWTDEERSTLSTVYYRFCRAYEAKGGKKLASTAADAMLAYIKVYGYQDLREKTDAEMKQSVAKVWEEITLQQERPAIDVKLAPQEDKAGGIPLISRVIPIAENKKPIKAAFIHDKTPELSGWTYSHEVGRKHLEQVFHGEVETSAYFNAMDGEPIELIEKAISEENTVIFTTSPQLLPASLRMAVEHPELTILNCSVNKSHRYIRTYYARIYEAKFVAGAIAGAMAGEHDVGYVCNYPIFGQVAGINAFALGVQMCNPTARVFLEWSAVGGVKAATKRLTDRGICLISSLDFPRQQDKHDTFGLSLIGEDGQVNLAMPVWNWGVYYETVLRHIQKKMFQKEYQESSKALNYYWGMASGAVNILCSDRLPDSTRKMAATLRDSIRAELCQPFRGPLHAQDGHLIAKKDEVLSTEQIINMDWLCEGVVGSLPTYDELSETGKGTVDIVGIDPLTKEQK